VEGDAFMLSVERTFHNQRFIRTLVHQRNVQDRRDISRRREELVDMKSKYSIPIWLSAASISL
jgi:hypothetical protein